jgi:mediator of RNA polymerase II transcription subunit 5
MNGAGDVGPAEGVQAWRSALQTAMKKRLRWDQLPLRELSRTHRASLQEIADLVVDLHPKNATWFVDPLIPRYTEALIRNRCTSPACVLSALLRSSRLGDQSAVAVYVTGANHSDDPTFEDQMFTLLRTMLAASRFTAGQPQIMSLINVLIRWLNKARKASEADVSKQVAAGALSGEHGSAASTYESLGLLAIAIFGHSSFREVDTLPFWKIRRAQIVSEIQMYDSQVMQWIQSQYAGQLQNLTNSRPFLETDENGLPKLTDEQILGSVVDIPMVTSRAGLFVWLSACLCARPLTDDATMRNYVLVRSKDDAQTAAVDLLVASFDVLTNALLSRETTQNVRFIRSFICHKLPLLLNSLLGYSGPGAVESCVQMSFMAITMDPLAPLSTGATETRDVLKKTKLEFLFACALHSLVSERAIANLVQEQSVVMPKTTKYTKESLMTQTSNNTGRLDTVIQELDLMSGNASAISGCIVETINNLCASRDTAELRTVCTSLTKKFPNIDVIMLFTQPTNIFLPLCNLLNDWVHDQESSEFQPPYEEFACIFLFVLAAIHRYDLTATDLGITQDDSFIMKILRCVPQNLNYKDVTEEQKKQLGKWIDGLYSTDEHGETTGIGDEVMSQCPPQAFYMLVPTLFEQSVLACKTNHLSIDTLRGGLEFLLEPFLLPSLVGGLNWLVKHSWKDNNDVDILLPMLEKLLKPSGSSQDMQAMHRCILGIVATPLEGSLQILIKRKPEKRDKANELIELLKPHLHQRRTMEITIAKLDEIAASGGGLLDRAVTNTVRDLALWAANGSSDPPPRYAPHLVHWAISSHTSSRVLEAVIEGLRDQINIGNGPVALDICVALVCRPEPATYVPLMNTAIPEPQITGRTLHDAIRLSTMDAQKLLIMNTADAEALVRLARRVEAQSTVSQVALVNLPASTEEQAMADQVMQGLGITTGDGPLVVGDSLLVGDTSLDQNGNTDFSTADFSAAANGAMDLGDSTNQNLNDMMQLDNSNDIFGDINVDFGQANQQNGQGVMGDGGQQQNAEEDIFAGLDMGDLGGDFDFS